VLSALALIFVAVVIIGQGWYFRDTHEFVLYFRTPVTGLREGAPVRFKGIEVGSVKTIRINISELKSDPSDLRIPVVIELDQDRLTAQGVQLDLGKKSTLTRLIAQGLRAQLASESLVTGVRYISLDIHPGTPVRRVDDPTVAHPEIPVIAEPTEQIQQEVARVAEGLAAIDYEGLSQSIHALTDTLTPQVRDTLAEIEQAARSVRLFADQLSRDPGSLMRGGNQ
jgi:paraquat-inducible protein B